MPIITDSGGFQVFSLAYGSVADELKSQGKRKRDGHVLKIDEEGVLFRSYRDGAPIFLTPESSIAAQKAFGADIIIPLDELPPYHIGPEKLKRSLDRTHRWEKRSLDEHLKNPQNQAIYAVIHGGSTPILRKESCDFLTALPFDGFSIGGSLGKTKPEMVEMLTRVLPQTARRKTKPPSRHRGYSNRSRSAFRWESIPLTVPIPPRAARHGLLLTQEGGMKAEKAEHAALFAPIEQGCNCWTCAHFSSAYLHHLFKAKEMAAHTLGDRP